MSRFLEEEEAYDDDGDYTSPPLSMFGESMPANPCCQVSVPRQDDK